ncbi:MAG: hypothetical protein KJ737_03385 [Proteobacteria bacterium]|nr:hypothetical protein [Pseudomonadota bacterium]
MKRSVFASLRAMATDEQASAPVPQDRVSLLIALSKHLYRIMDCDVLGVLTICAKVRFRPLGKRCL